MNWIKTPKISPVLRGRRGEPQKIILSASTALFTQNQNHFSNFHKWHVTITQRRLAALLTER